MLTRMRIPLSSVLGLLALLVGSLAVVSVQGCSRYWRLDATIHGPRVAPPSHVLLADVVATERFAYQLGIPDGYAGDPCVAQDAMHFHCVLPPGTSMNGDVHIEGKPLLPRIGRDWSPPWSARFVITTRAVSAWRANAELTQVIKLPATGPNDGGPTPSVVLYVELASSGPARVEVAGIERDARSVRDRVWTSTPGIYLVQVQRPFAAPARRATVIATATAFGPCATDACPTPTSALRIASLRMAREEL